jgi:hypothetical protein
MPSKRTCKPACSLHTKSSPSKPQPVAHARGSEEQFKIIANSTGCRA